MISVPRREARETAVVHLDRGDARWDEFIDSRDDAGFFFSDAYLCVLEDVLGHRVFRLAALRGDRVVGVLPLVRTTGWPFGANLVSIPYVDTGGIIADDPGVIAALGECAARVAKRTRIRSVELRHLSPLLPGWPVSTGRSYFHLPLPDTVDVAWKSIGQKVRNAVRRSQKLGVKVVDADSRWWKPFFAVLATRYRELGSPLLPYAFFEALFYLQDRVRLVIAAIDGRVIGVRPLFLSRGRVEFMWAGVCGRWIHTGAMSHLYWRSIEIAIERGASRLDLGRSRDGSGNARFKASFGAVATPLHYQHLHADSVPRDAPSGVFTLASSVFKLLPDGLARAIGSRVAPGIP